ncbi:extracellular solute-binding protein [Alloiococcus sp. CFN-8]|uniref:extracellular solute-binding protein n=1 Tax=Alloiococcus sp. CFN-8 TaxID=3416081 RepID=UPI003CF79330
MLSAKKGLLALLSGMFIFTAVGCSSDSSKEGSSGGGSKSAEYLNTESQFPIVKEPIELTIMVKQAATHPEFDKIYNLQKYEEMTGIKINWINVPASGWDENLNLAMASGELPDIILKGSISSANQLSWGEDELLIDLMENDLLETYAPNFWSYMDKFEDVKQSQTFPNGAIYSIPAATEEPATRILRKLFINTEWLEAVNLDMPTTYEELYEVLKAFKEQDPNGNGVADEIGLYSSTGALYETFYGMFGLENRGTHHSSFDIDEDTGDIRYFPMDEDYREFLEFTKRLYEEGLLHEEMFSYSDSQMASWVVEDKAGIFINTSLSILPGNYTSKFKGLDEALEGPNGDKIWSGVRSHLHSTGAFVITSACEYPEAALRWVDYFYSDEGNAFYHYGIEGDTYVKNDDGSYSYTQEIIDKFAESSKDSVISNYSPYPYGNNPTIMKYPFFSGDELTPIPMEAADNLMPYIPEEIWPFFTFTKDENRIMTTYNTDIGNYVKTSTAEFITGQKELNDSTWKEYVSAIEKMGVEEMLNVYEAAYERIK